MCIYVYLITGSLNLITEAVEVNRPRVENLGTASASIDRINAIINRR
jgi:hypothetical protein